ncbi:MAG: hypothetical protein HKL84_04245 [Acidimicrobiaceae bacterium]|nr:hypothetical protein [Acidimicrobiaceae bacterium]
MTTGSTGEYRLAIAIIGVGISAPWTVLEVKRGFMATTSVSRRRVTNYICLALPEQGRDLR